MLQHHFISVGINVYKPTNTFFDNISVVLNATNPGSTLNKKPWCLDKSLLGRTFPTILWR